MLLCSTRDVYAASFSDDAARLLFMRLMVGLNVFLYKSALVRLAR